MADLTITIDARTLAGVQQAFREVQNAFKSLEQAAARSNAASATHLARLGAQLQSIETAARRIGIVATGALATVATALFRAGAEAEGVQARFTAISNSLQEAQQTIDAIKRTNAFQIFGQQTLNAAAQLKAVGVASQDLPRLIEAIANAASTAGDNASSAFARIATAIGQVATKGRASAEELQQQLSEFIPAQKLVAESLGVTTAEIQKLMQQGLPAGQTIRALTEGIERNFGRMTEALKQTPTGQLLLLRSTIQQLLREAGSPFAQALGELFASLRQNIIDLARSGAIQQFAQTLAETARSLAPALKQALQLLTQILQIFNALPAPVKTLAILLGPSSLIIAGLARATTLAIKFGQSLVALYNWLRTGALASALTRTLGAGATAGAAGAAAITRVGGVAALALAPSTASAQTAEYSNAVAGAELAILQSNPSLRNNPQELRRQAQQLVADNPQLLQTAQRGGYRAAQQQATQILAQNQPLPPTTNPFANLNSGFEPRLTKTKQPTARSATTDPAAARIQLARDIAELQIPSITALIDAGKLAEARQQLAKLRAELEQLAKRYTQVVIKETETQVQRKLAASERIALAEKTRREFLQDAENLAQQIAKLEQQQHENKLRAIEQERERAAQAMREIHQLRIQLAEAQLANLPPEQQREQLQRTFNLQAAPIIAELITGDPRTAALKLATLQEQYAQRINALNEQIAAEQQKRAQELYATRLQILEIEQSIARTRAQATLELANAELQNARDTLQLLQQQGASREMLRAAQEAVLNAQAKQLETQRQALLTELQLNNAAAERARAQYMLIKLFDSQNTLQQRQLELQLAQLDVDRARINASLAQIERQLKNINIVVDENNPLNLWMASFQSAAHQLNAIFADAILGFNRFGKSLKDWLRNLARDFLAILMRNLLNPLYIALQQIAARIAAALFAALGVSNAAAGVGASATGAAAGAAGIGLLGGVAIAAGVGYLGGQALRLNPTGSAVGAGIGFAIGGPVGALVGGLFGGLFGKRERQPQVQIIPLAPTSPTAIRNDIRLYLDNREISRAIVTNAF